MSSCHQEQGGQQEHRGQREHQRPDHAEGVTGLRYRQHDRRYARSAGDRAGQVQAALAGRRSRGCSLTLATMKVPADVRTDVDEVCDLLAVQFLLVVVEVALGVFPSLGGDPG